jgi:8-oxo-dGTP diphosphatase
VEERLFPARPLLGASIAVFREGAVLLARRARPPAEGLFSLPGGLVEPGETLAEAALRELREEVGVEAEITGFIAPVEVIEREVDGRVRRHFVICAHAGRWLFGEPSPGPECREARWVRPDELATLPTTAGLPALLAKTFGQHGARA